MKQDEINPFQQIAPPAVVEGELLRKQRYFCTFKPRVSEVGHLRNTFYSFDKPGFVFANQTVAESQGICKTFSVWKEIGSVKGRR